MHSSESIEFLLRMHQNVASATAIMSNLLIFGAYNGLLFMIQT